MHSIEALVEKFLSDACALGLSPKDALQRVRERIAAMADQFIVGADAERLPRPADRELPAVRAQRPGPRFGATYVHPSDSVKRWTKSTKLGAPARWLTDLVRATGKSYADFEVVEDARSKKPEPLENPFPFQN